MNLTHRLEPIEDEYLKTLKANWFEQKNLHITLPFFLPNAIHWFKSTKLNSLDGLDSFCFQDVTMGCTHFIESIVIKYGWDGFQILNDEYAYYRLMGKHGTNVDDLKEDIPLILSLPNWKYGDIRPDWNDVLKICEQRNIDIHIDMAWLTCAKNINIDLNHPNIKSFAMSMSKYAMQWNRIGVRWTKQRTMDSITIFNQYYGDVNTALTSCGYYMMKHLPRDYAWNTYESRYNNLCTTLDLIPTNCIQIVKKKNEEILYGISNLLVKND